MTSTSTVTQTMTTIRVERETITIITTSTSPITVTTVSELRIERTLTLLRETTVTNLRVNWLPSIVLLIVGLALGAVIARFLFK